MMRVVYKHDYRPYYDNPMLRVIEYDYKYPEQSADWPAEYQHPLACKIEFDSEAVDLAWLEEDMKYLQTTGGKQ